MFKGTSEPMFESNDSTVMTFKRKENLKGTNFAELSSAKFTIIA